MRLDAIATFVCASLALACSTTYVVGGNVVDTRGDVGADSASIDGAADGGVETGCVVCGDACVDVSSDPAHCGGCDLPCPPALLCDHAVCVKKDCPKDTVSCPDGTCDDLLSDPDHCGDCTTKCGIDARGTPRICDGATCTPDCSKPPLAICVAGAKECTDLDTDDESCGACFRTCAHGTKCAKGSCIPCADPKVICGEACIDVRTDPANCGACGRACPAGQACSAGLCGCPRGLTDCGGACKDLNDDATSCGACGHACAAGLVCDAGVCGATCATGRTACGVLCVDLTTDPANCGACDTPCDVATPYCVSSACSATPKCNAGPYDVLFYGDLGSLERAYLPPTVRVDVKAGGEWAKMSASDFASYQLVVLGEGGFGVPTDWDAAAANVITWEKAITGRVVVTTLDPAHHPSIPAATTVLKAMLAWAASGPGTGLYVATDYGQRHLDFLPAFGDAPPAWDEIGQEDASGYLGDDVTIVAPTHPTMIGSTSDALSKWGFSYHAGLTKIPAAFVTVAQGAPPAADAGPAGPTTAVAARDVACVP